MKTRLLLFVVVVFIGGNVYGQAPSWEWAKDAGGSVSDLGNSITADASGNIYVTGYFESLYCVFDSDTLFNSWSGAANIFLAKYDSLGHLLWVKTANGSGQGISVTTDLIGNVYLVGSFQASPLIFGNDTLINASFGTDDIFLAKYDANGNFKWVKRAGGNDADEPISIIADSSGNAYITGYFMSTSVIFGNDTLHFVAGGSYFIAKYDSSGNVLWAKTAGPGIGNGITISRDGNVDVAGSFSKGQPFILGNDTLQNLDTLAYTGDVFVAKYSPNGNVLWAKSAGGTERDEALAISTDTVGNIFVTGGFQSSMMFIGNDTLINSGGNIFVAKYNFSGNLLWAKCFGGSNGDYALSISTDVGGNSYLTGWLSSPTVIFGNDTLTNQGLYIAKLDSLGNAVWAVGADADRGSSIYTDRIGNCYVTGYFEGASANFGSYNLISHNSASFYDDIFIAKLGSIITNVEDIIKENTFVQIYPNPAHNKLTVVFYSSIRMQNVVSLYDVMGRVVLEKSFQASGGENKLEVDVADLAKGVYVLRVGEERVKVVVE